MFLFYLSFFFFFKQKTAYYMRISDWSSDVCSSDLMICSVPLCNVSRMDLNDLDSPGKRLKWAREKAGFQQAGDFAKRVGVHPTIYRAYENDQNGFAKKVHEFAERLGVTGDRKSIVSGRWLEVCVELGGRRMG